APVNDNVNNATLITALPYTTSISTALATSESGYGGCGNIGKTVWYKYVATSSGNMIADTVGSNFDTVLVAYTDANLSSGTYTACNDDYNGMQSQVSFQAQAGTTYYFRAGGYSGASGDLTLGVSAVTCDQSTLILSTNGDTANGTLDSGDCPSMDSSGSYADLYTFGGTAGQKIQIIMQTTANYTYPYLYLKKSDGTIISQGGISCDSSYSKGCIPSNVSSGGYYSLPVNDTYTIVTTSYYPEYFFDFDYSLTLKEYTPPVCDQTTLTLSTGGQTTSDALDIGDCQSDDRNGSYADLYTFNGAAGDQIQVDMDTIPNYYTFPYLYLKKSDGTILAHLSEGDGYWYQMNNTTYYRDYLPFYTADPRTSYALPENGTYTIVATSHDPGATYNYSITLRKTN
ncbi:MAG: hypothetical protein U1C49_01360, partial [Candidatus Andersenbacteria bacterium]|nr:hypothetical protein [Candidatus Andersenbacteria bacterium]